MRVSPPGGWWCFFLFVTPALITLSGCGRDAGASASSQRQRVSLIDGPARVDVGDAVRGASGSFEFTVVNDRANRTIHVAQVVSSCGCTSVTIDRTEIAPGQTATVSGVIEAPELATGASASVTLLAESTEHLFQTRVSIRSVDPLDSAAAVWSESRVRIPVHSAYDASDYTFAVYRRRDDALVRHHIDSAGAQAALVVEFETTESLPAFVVVMKENAARGLRLAQSFSSVVSPQPQNVSAGTDERSGS